MSLKHLVISVVCYKLRQNEAKGTSLCNARYMHIYLFSTVRGNMNNISSCSVKSTYVAFLALIVNNHSFYSTRIFTRYNWHQEMYWQHLRWNLHWIMGLSQTIVFNWQDSQILQCTTHSIIFLIMKICILHR